MNVYLEYKDEKSDKFWEVSVSENIVTRRWGKVGTTGQTKAKEYESAEAAEKASLKLRDEKVGKGYKQGHPDPEKNLLLQRARLIRKRLRGSEDFADPFPSKPKSVRWKTYWALFLEARDIERTLAELFQKPKLRQFASNKWEMTDFPAIDPEMERSLKDLVVPDNVKIILTSLEKIEKNDGILVIQNPVDLATMFIILSHKNVRKIKEIRYKNWSPVDIEEIKKKCLTGICQFKDLFHINVPDFIFELNHYIECMEELGNFDLCWAQGFQETEYGIFWSVLEGEKPEINHIADFRSSLHYLNYFAIAQCDRTTFGLVFDYNENSFSPYFFESDIDTFPLGGVWDCLLGNMWLDDPCFLFDEFGSFDDLNGQLDDALDSYSLATWFYKLVTIGYLNFFGKPSIELEGVDKIKYGNQTETLTFSEGKKSSNLLSAALDTYQFMPAYPIKIKDNFNPVFNDVSLSSLLWACKYFDDGIYRVYVNNSYEERVGVLLALGLNPETWNKSKNGAESKFLKAVENFCNEEIKSGRPYLAFLVGMTIWGTDKGRDKLTVRLLQKVPDDICHPILKLAAREYVERNYE